MNSEIKSAIFFDKFAITFDSFYEHKRNFFMQWIDKKFRKDIFLRYLYTFEVLGQLNGKSILDIGCGSGIYLIEALKRNADFVTGIDHAKGMLKLAEDRLMNFYNKDKFELIDSTFPHDGIVKHNHAIVMGVMDYIEDSQSFLYELKNVITESAILSFPSKNWFRTPFRKFRYKLRKCPVFFYDEKNIERISKNAGFKDVQIRKIPGAGMDYHVVLKP